MAQFVLCLIPFRWLSSRNKALGSPVKEGGMRALGLRPIRTLERLSIHLFKRIVLHCDLSGAQQFPGDA